MNSVLSIRWRDIEGMRRTENALGKLDDFDRSTAIRRAVNHTGDKAKTVVTRTLAKQTGLPYRTIKKAIKVDRADYRSLEYSLTTSGGDISLKYFKARETRGGVTAAPFGKRTLFPGTFMKGGRFPNRVTARGLGGHVYSPDRSASRWYRPVSFVDSGVIIPREMIKDETARAFNTTVARDLPNRTMHEISFLVPGFFD